MSENEKKELNETELEKAAGGVSIYSHCSDYQDESGNVLPESFWRCSSCAHFKSNYTDDRKGTCDLGH